MPAPNIRVRGIHGSIPAGYVVGRASNGNGAPELIPFASLGTALVTAGAVAAPNNTPVPAVTSVDATVPTGLAVSGGPITTAGTLTFTWSGTIPASSLPNPSASTLGGVQSAAAVSHQWIDSISTSGVPHLSQPAQADVTGLGTADSVTHGSLTLNPAANTNALSIVGGNHTGSNATSDFSLATTLNTGGNPTVIKANVINTAVGSNTTARLISLQGGVSGTTELFGVDMNGNWYQPNNTSLVSSGDLNFGAGGLTHSLSFRNTSHFLEIRSDGGFGWSSDTSGQDAADTGLSRISAGVIGVGTGAQGSFAGGIKLTTLTLAGTGGTSQVLQQSSAGAAVTVGQLGFSDLSGSLATSQLPSSTGTATAVAGAATLNKSAGVITSEALVAATGYTLTLTDSLITAASVVLITVWSSSGVSIPVNVGSVTPGSGSVVIVLGMAALTGTVKIAFAVFN